MLDMEITGSIQYEVKISDGNYQVTFSRTEDSELASLMISREVIKNSKEFLMNQLKDSKQKVALKDRIQKVTTTEYTLGKIIEAYLGNKAYEAEIKNLTNKNKTDEPASEPTKTSNQIADSWLVLNETL